MVLRRFGLRAHRVTRLVGKAAGILLLLPGPGRANPGAAADIGQASLGVIVYFVGYGSVLLSSESSKHSSKDSSDSSRQKQGEYVLRMAARTGRSLAVVAMHPPGSTGAVDQEVPPGMTLVELAEPGASAAPVRLSGAHTAPTLVLAINDDRLDGIGPGSLLRPRLMGTDGIQLLAGARLVVFIPTLAERDRLGADSRLRS